MTAQSFSPQGGDTRSAARTHMCLSASIRFGAVSAAIRLRDLSASGARIEGSRLPAVGSAAQVVRGLLEASGTIVWRDSKGCGFRFDTPLPLDEWMPPRSYGEQQTVDKMVDSVRSDLGQVVPIRLVQSPAALSDALPRRMAEELAYVARLLDSLGDDLCNEPLVVARHGGKLQNLDIAAQILGHVAALLVTENAAQAVDAIGMTCLRKRLLRTGL